MVQWQGEINKEQSGLKAARLDSIDSLEVPNFFTITREEVKQFVGREKDPKEIMNSKIPSDLMQKIKEAQEEIGMSSEVRNASGRAKNLVGGQRDSQRVSIRVSDEEKGLYDYELNVGTSNLEKALKKVIASYYREEKEGNPAVIIQKMVEPGETGSVILNFTERFSLFEATEGLGDSLEQGITTPEIYLVDDEAVKGKRVPQEQVKMTRNPMNGQDRRRKVKRSSSAFGESKVENFAEKVSREALSVKFVHKRGTFYVVDAFKAEQVSDQETVEGLRVSEGEIEGRAGVEVSLSDQTVGPEDFKNSLIARRGGFVSTDAQRARAEGKPAVFSFSGELEEEQEIFIPSRDVEIKEPRAIDKSGEDIEGSTGEVTATEVIPLESPQVNLTSPFSGYSIKGEELEAEDIVKSYREVLEFSGDIFVLDARELDGEALLNSAEYLDAEEKYYLISRPERGLLRKAVEEDASVIAPEKILKETERVLAQEEKRLILEHVRESN